MKVSVQEFLMHYVHYEILVPDFLVMYIMKVLHKEIV